METTMDDLVQIAGMAGTIPDYKAREILSAVLPAIARKMEEATPESAAKLAAMMFDDLGSLSMRKAQHAPVYDARVLSPAPRHRHGCRASTRQ